MKGQISRLSFRPERRYSGVYHSQGAMITDADLDERSDIARARTDGLGHDAIRDGCPAVGGAADLSGASPLLREGVIYADGVRGLLRLDGDPTPGTLATVFATQADLPEGPALPGGPRVVYADIWERPVFPLEDPYLADPGLHGAETAFRTQTMCQIKSAALADAGDVEDGTGRYPLIGTARLAVTERTPSSTVDECDPCADVVPAELRVANTLWRLEVVRVRGAANSPTSIDLAWSAENGAAIAPGDVESEAFEAAGAVYERFSGVTERHMGALANPNDQKDSVFVEDLDAGGDFGMPFVRRWDGWARITLSSGNVQRKGDGFSIAFDGTVVTLVTDTFEAALEIGSRALLKGDYWLVETRTFAEPASRIRLVSETPVGIRHHHCVLFRSNATVAEEPTDAERRKLTFPPLSDLPADHVSIVNTCPKLYDDAENVQEALDALCDIDAGDIPFDNNCPRLYDGAGTVQQALDNLCKVDFNVETLLRLMMDWGVVCGLQVVATDKPSRFVSTFAGWFLDRAGRLASAEAATVDTGKLFEALSQEEQKEIAEALPAGGVCLTVALDDQRSPRFHLVPKDRAFGPDDPGFRETVRRCIEKKGGLDLAAATEGLSAAQRGAVDKAILIATQPDTLGRAQRMSAAEETRARKFMDGLQQSFDRIAEPHEREKLEVRLNELDEEFAGDNSVGAQKEIRRAQYAATRLAAVLDADQERQQRCLCFGLFPSCPPDLGEPPFHVPLACLTGRILTDGNVPIFISKACMYACRKQALTWRGVDYLIRDWRERLALQLAEACCADPEREGGTDVTGGIGNALVLDRMAADNPLVYMAQNQRLFDGVIGEQVTVSDRFRKKVDIGDLGLAAATDVISGHGGEVVERVDVNDAKAVETIVERAGGDVTGFLADPGDIAPGDKVAMLVEGGEARGYVVVERGGGKFFFTPESEKAATAPTGGARPPRPGSDIALDEARLGELAALAERLEKAAGAETEAEIEELMRRRDALRTDVQALESETNALVQKQHEASLRVAEAEQQVGKVLQDHQEAVEKVRETQVELKKMARERDEILSVLRLNQPVASLELNARLKQKLAEQNVTTVEEARRRADALGLTANELTLLRRRIDDFVSTGRR